MRSEWLQRGVLVGLFFLLLLGTSGFAHAQERQCADEFRRADAVYLEGRFDETIRLLRTCLDRATLFVEEAIPVYRLMAMAHLNQGENEEAQATIADLLVLAPDYEADPIQDPPSYVSLVTEQREEIAQQAGAQAEVVEETPLIDEEPAAEIEASDEDVTPVPDFSPVVDQEEEQDPLPSTPRDTRSFIERPKSLLIAGSGALIIFAALGLAMGGPDTGSQ
ncbi:MAG TPA: hypothetical protein VKP65_19420 [Rhodothermales bacterium]|nr:hypothetical protein [Rhodothermales bacterium]